MMDKLSPQRLQVRFRLRSHFKEIGQLAAGEITALCARRDRAADRAFSDFTQALAVVGFHARRKASGAVDVFRFDRRVVGFGPLPGRFFPQGVVIRGRRDEGLAFFAFEPAAGNHVSSPYL
jgi:hypothetical protein